MCLGEHGIIDSNLHVDNVGWFFNGLSSTFGFEKIFLLKGSSESGVFSNLIFLFKHISHCLPQKAPRLIEGAYNNTIIRLKKQTKISGVLVAHSPKKSHLAVLSQLSLQS